MDVRNTQPVTGHRRGLPADGRRGRHQGRDHPRRRQADADQVPRPQPRHLYRPVGRGLLGSAHQRRDLRPQPGQRRRRQVEDAGLAQCLGHPGADEEDRRRRCSSATRPSAPRCTRNCRQTFRETSPFVMLFQQTEVAGLPRQRQGLQARPDFDTNFIVHGLQAVIGGTGRLTPWRATQAGRRARRRPRRCAVASTPSAASCVDRRARPISACWPSPSSSAA